MALVRYPAKGAGGGGGSGSNVNGFSYNIASETATITTDQPGTFPAIFPIQHRQVIEVRKDGNDSTAPLSTVAPYSVQNAFLTFEAAWAAAGPDDIIWVRPGSYTPAITSSWTTAGPKAVYCDPGVIFNNAAGPIVVFEEEGEFYWGGAAEFEVVTDCFVNNVSYFKFTLEFNKASNFAGNQLANLQNVDAKIRVNELINVGFDLRNWIRFRMAVDYWESKDWLFFTSSPDGSNFDLYGQAQIYISGRSSDKAFIRRNNSSTAGILLGAGAYNARNLNVEIHANWLWMDGYAVDHQGGMLTLIGTIIPQKSGEAGNELPFYSCTSTSPGSQYYKPVFTHIGKMVMGGSLFNNTMVDIRQAGTFKFDGEYKSSGEDEQGLSTPFPCISVSNQDVDGQTNVTFNGVFATGRAADVGPIRINEIGNPNNELRIQFLNVLAICENTEKAVGPIYGTAVIPPINLWVYHSLGMTGPWDTAYFTNPLSVDRSYYDTSISYSIPEYEGP